MLPCSRYSQKYRHPTTRSTMWLVEALFLLVPNIVQIYWCLNWGTLPSITDAPYGRPMLVGCCGTRWRWFIWFIVWARAATPARHIQPDYWIVVSPPPNNRTWLQLSNWGNNSSSMFFIDRKETRLKWVKILYSPQSPPQISMPESKVQMSKNDSATRSDSKQ